MTFFEICKLSLNNNLQVPNRLMMNGKIDKVLSFCLKFKCYCCLLKGTGSHLQRNDWGKLKERNIFKYMCRIRGNLQEKVKHPGTNNSK